MYFQINILAVLLAGISSMVVGFVWYSPMMFAAPWMKLMGYTASSMKKNQKAMGPMYGLSFVATLVSATVLWFAAMLLGNATDYSRLVSCLVAAFAIWLGFIAPVQLTDVIFGGKKANLFLINTGYQLASMVVMAIVFSFF